MFLKYNFFMFWGYFGHFSFFGPREGAKNFRRVLKGGRKILDGRSFQIPSLLSLFLPKRKKSYLQLPVITCRREIYLCLSITTWLYLIWFRTIELPVVPLWSSCSVDYPLVVRHFTWNYLSVHEISVLNRGYRKMT